MFRIRGTAFLKPIRSDSPIVAALLLAVLTLVAASPLLSTGWFVTHEALTPLERVLAYAEELRHGDIYPRWLSLSYNGKGSPFFNFYSPAYYLVCAWLYLAGLPLLMAVKGPLLLLFFGGSWGIYLWSRRHFGPQSGILSAILYLFVPYHFVDLYVRGAFAEFAALAVLPYLFWGIDQALEPADKTRGVYLVAMAAALILLFHHLSAIMILPFAVGYTLLRWASLGYRRGGLLAVCAGTLLGAGLTAFYWVPVLAEREDLLDFSKAVTQGYFFYKNHFVLFWQWISPVWGFGESLIGPDDGMSFQIGLLLIASTILSVLILLLKRDKSSALPWQTLALAAGALFLTVPWSEFIYRLFPPFVYVQFPWRFLGPATLFLCMTCGILGVIGKDRRFKAVMLVVVSAAAICLSTNQRVIQRSVVEDFDVLAPAAVSSLAFGSLCSGDEYLPRWVVPSAFDAPPGVPPYITSGQITGLETHGKLIQFSTEVPDGGATVILPIFYFPGWKSAVDDHPAAVAPSPEGFLSVQIPAGAHSIRIWFGTTAARVSGWLLTGFTLAGGIGILFLRRRKNLEGQQALGHE